MPTHSEDNGPPIDHRLYVPILKGKRGELDALAGMTDDDAEWTLPIVEVVPTGLEEDDPGQIQLDIRKFAERLAKSWSFRHDICVDVGQMSPDTSVVNGLLPVQYALQELRARELSVIVVVRPSDSPAVRDAIAREQFDGLDVCVRLTADDLDQGAPIDQVLDTLLRDTGVSVNRTHLVIDLGEIPNDGMISLMSQMARLILAGVPELDLWKSISVGAGAFPASLSQFRAGDVGRLPRHDWTLWRGIAQRASGRIPGFADYGVAHPAIPQGAAFAPAPQIRYTTDEHWIALRGLKSVRRGNSQFYDICRQLVSMPEYSGPEFSRGDGDIFRAALSAPEDVAPLIGPGNATTWRSIGTSHHLAFVVNRLANGPEI